MPAEQISGLSAGQGGIQYRIPLSGIDKKLQLKFKRRLKAVEKQAEPEQLPAEVDLENLTEDERQQISFWKRTLEEWHRYRDEAENKEIADQEFVTMFLIRHPEMTLNRRTLYRKWKGLKKPWEVPEMLREDWY